MSHHSNKSSSNIDETKEKQFGSPGKKQNGIYEISYFGEKFINVDDEVCEALGFRRDELLSLNPLELLDDQSFDAFADLLLRKELNTDYDRSMRFRVKNKDGVYKTFTANLIEFKYTDGLPSSAIVSVTDILEEEKSG